MPLVIRVKGVPPIGRLAFVPFVIGTLAMSACGKSREQTVPPPGRGTGTGMCRVIKARAQFTAEKSSDAVFLFVDIAGSKRGKIRSFLRGMAARHEDRRYTKGRMRHREALVPHATSLIYTDSGVRMMYTPLSETDLDLLYEGLLKHVAELPARCGASTPAAFIDDVDAWPGSVDMGNGRLIAAFQRRKQRGSAMGDPSEIGNSSPRSESEQERESTPGATEADAHNIAKEKRYPAQLSSQSLPVLCSACKEVAIVGLDEPIPLCADCHERARAGPDEFDIGGGG